MKNWKYINGAEVGNEIPNSQINGPSAAEIREIAGRVYKTDMRKDDLARAVSFELAKKYKSFQTNSHIMDMVSEVLSKFKIGNETMHEWATSKPRNIGNAKYDIAFQGQIDGNSEQYYFVYDYQTDPGAHRPVKKFKTRDEARAYAKKLNEKDKVGNTKVINSDREFFKELADDAKEREDKDKQEVEKLVENRLDWSENLVGKEVWVKSKGDEWKCYVMQDKGDKVYIRHDADGSQGWVSKERITGKVNNSKAGNVASEYEILKHDPSKMHPMYKKAYEEAMKKLAREDEEFKKRFEKEYGVKAKNEASDDKFAYVMREFDEGKLKTPDGKVVTDPAQAKAIAYSESNKTENGLARARNAIKK